MKQGDQVMNTLTIIIIGLSSLKIVSTVYNSITKNNILGIHLTTEANDLYTEN